MGFMQIEVLEKARVFEVDTTLGTFYVPNTVVVPHPALKEGVAIEADDEIAPGLIAALVDYVEGGPTSIQEITLRFGYLGRYQAPGYMDATDWMFGTNYRELVRELKQMYRDE
jgi:hypothetical protein